MTVALLLEAFSGTNIQLLFIGLTCVMCALWLGRICRIVDEIKKLLEKWQ